MKTGRHLESRSAIFIPLTLAMLGLGGVVSGLNYLALGFTLPLATLLGTVFSLVPLVILTWYFLWLDSSKVESKAILFLAFLWGAVGATGWALIINTAGAAFLGETIGIVVVAPVAEELFKGALLFAIYFWSRTHFDGVLDGLVFAGFIGMGFAFVENITYFTAAYGGIEVFSDSGTSEGGAAMLFGTFLARGILTPFAHPLFTTLTGLGVGLALSRSRPRDRAFLMAGGLAFSILLHALWNGTLTLGSPGFSLLLYILFFIPAFALYLVFGAQQRVKAVRDQARAIEQLVQYGLLAPQHQGWLSSPSSRRRVVRAARRDLTPWAANAVREYQRGAIRLVQHHLRLEQGLAGENAVERAWLHSHELRQLATAFPAPPLHLYA